MRNDGTPYARYSAEVVDSPRINALGKPEAYVENSPIFNANRVTTPLLMMNNKEDAVVSFEQGVELFTALRRLNKRGMDVTV